MPEWKFPAYLKGFGPDSHMSDAEEKSMPDLTLIEKLRQIADAKKGDPMPECLQAPSTFTEYARDPKSGVAVGFNNDDWGTPLSAICKEAAETIQRYEKLFGRLS